MEDPAPKTARRQEAASARVSWWGIAGGLWATITFSVVAVLVVVDPGDESPWLAAAYGGVAVCFVPAIVYSMAPWRGREVVMRVSTAMCLLFAAAGAFVFKDIGIPVLLAPPTIMLATAAGWTFPGGRTKKEGDGQTDKPTN